MDKFQQQRENWGKLYGKPFSETEYFEVFRNLAGFFEVLKEWSDKEKNQGANNEP
jgi:hypothetical protein